MNAESEDDHVESVCDKVNGATYAARCLAYREFPRGPRDLALLGDKLERLVWAYADGLYWEFHWRHAQGRTSLADLLMYDMVKWERTTEIHRALFQALLAGVIKRDTGAAEAWDAGNGRSADNAGRGDSPEGESRVE